MRRYPKLYRKSIRYLRLYFQIFTGVDVSVSVLCFWFMRFVDNFNLIWLQVKVENWADGEKGLTHSGMTARFGSSLPEKAENSVRTPAVLSNPSDCCSPLTSKVLFYFIFLFCLFCFSYNLDKLNNCFECVVCFLFCSYLTLLLYVFAVVVIFKLKLHLHSLEVLLVFWLLIMKRVRFNASYVMFYSFIVYSLFLYVL